MGGTGVSVHQRPLRLFLPHLIRLLLKQTLPLFLRLTIVMQTSIDVSRIFHLVHASRLNLLTSLELVSPDFGYVSMNEHLAHTYTKPSGEI